MLVTYLMSKPSVANAEIMVIAILTKSYTIGVRIRVPCVRYAMRTHEMPPANSGSPRARVGIHEYDFGVHIIARRSSLIKKDIKGSPIFIGSYRCRRVSDYDSEVALCTTKLGDKQPRSQQSESHECWDKMRTYHDAYSQITRVVTFGVKQRVVTIGRNRATIVVPRTTNLLKSDDVSPEFAPEQRIQLLMPSCRGACVRVCLN